jgi:hypothetical protein
MGCLFRQSEKVNAHVRIFGSVFIIQNRPFHIKEGRI